MFQKFFMIKQKQAVVTTNLMQQFKEYLIKNNIVFYTSRAYDNLIFFGQGNFAVYHDEQIEINLRGWETPRSYTQSNLHVILGTLASDLN